LWETVYVPLDDEDLNSAVSRAAYEELRKRARWLRRRKGGGLTLDTTSLVHEAFIKLSNAAAFRAVSHAHLMNALAQAMEQILVDAARRKSAVSHGGGVVHVPADGTEVQGQVASAEVTLAVADALRVVEASNPAGARAVRLQFFVGLSLAEIAAALGLPEDEARRRLRRARAALKRVLSDSSSAPCTDT
jgi:RNA polymerase sigma factor (TIGR02999 family)